ncbi:uncharacterized protein LOC141619859 [Silene latifolia]|uniref:uncharacterized protein LOC141619859 n=1 Tax=Silene latifolia TaxID=37657 RepID=UPI003D773C58
MSTANLLRLLSFNYFANHRIFHPQWLRRNGVRCFSHTADASGLPVRYISKRRQVVDIKQSTSSAAHISLQHGIPSTSHSTVLTPNTFQGLPVDTTDGKMLKIEGPILNHWNGHEKQDLIDEQHIKVHNQVVDCIKTGQVVAHKTGGPTEGIKLNEELGSDGLVDEECMEAPEEVFEDVQSNNTYFKAKPDKTKQAAEKLAVQLLARRAFTAVELRKKLGAKLFPLNVVEAVVRDFQDRGLINDGLYAETFSHSRWKSSSWGPRRIKQALSTKGVSEEDVKKAVKLVFEDCEEGEERSSVRLSSCSLQQLYVQASKQWERSHDVGDEKRKARVIRWLQYRGFDWGVIGSIIKKLESDNPRGMGR